MHFWLSGEVNHDVADACRVVRNKLEADLNSALLGRDYGCSVDEWALIFIVLPTNDSRYAEVRKFWKKRRVVEFRLQVDHAAFLSADAHGRMKLLCESIIRSIDLASSLKLGDFPREEFRRDIVEVVDRITTTAVRP
jgi:hypothetical protein